VLRAVDLPHRALADLLAHDIGTELRRLEGLPSQAEVHVRRERGQRDRETDHDLVPGDVGDEPAIRDRNSHLRPEFPVGELDGEQRRRGGQREEKGPTTGARHENGPTEEHQAHERDEEHRPALVAELVVRQAGGHGRPRERGVDDHEDPGGNARPMEDDEEGGGGEHGREDDAPGTVEQAGGPPATRHDVGQPGVGTEDERGDAEDPDAEPEPTVEIVVELRLEVRGAAAQSTPGSPVPVGLHGKNRPRCGEPERAGMLTALLRAKGSSPRGLRPRPRRSPAR
jgi:hypothetical protein